MKQHIAVFTLGLSLLTSCMTDSAYRKVENGLVADIRSGQAKAVKLEVISDDIIRVIASPDGKFSNQVNLIKDTKSLPAPSFQITTSGSWKHACKWHRTLLLWYWRCAVRLFYRIICIINPCTSLLIS